VASLLFERGGNVLEAQQFNDQASSAFFMQVESGAYSARRSREEFAPVAAGDMRCAGTWCCATGRGEVLILVSSSTSTGRSALSTG
jgi:formyltetrahydrofolate hydrolase